MWALLCQRAKIFQAKIFVGKSTNGVELKKSKKAAVFIDLGLFEGQPSTFVARYLKAILIH